MKEEDIKKIAHNLFQKDKGSRVDPDEITKKLAEWMKLEVKK